MISKDSPPVFYKDSSKKQKNVSKNIDVVSEMIRVAPAAATGRHLEGRKQSAHQVMLQRALLTSDECSLTVWVPQIPTAVYLFRLVHNV